jgi:hypothetical protein
LRNAPNYDRTALLAVPHEQVVLRFTVPHDPRMPVGSV